MITQTKGLSHFPLSAKVFVSLMLCVAGLAYVTLLGSIWFDTEFKLTHIRDGYGSMGSIELMHHSFQYLFWFLGVFTLLGSLLLISAYSEKLKFTFALLIPSLILSDIGAAWLVGYNSAFAWVMAISGFLLASAFLCLFTLIQRDLWLKNPSTD